MHFYLEGIKLYCTAEMSVYDKYAFMMLYMCNTLSRAIFFK